MWHQFFCGSPQKWPKMHWMLDDKYFFDTLLNSHFTLISKRITKISNCQILLPKVKEGLTIKDPNMNSWIKNYVTRLGIFQYVRVILQYSLPLDHPVVRQYHKHLCLSSTVSSKKWSVVKDSPNWELLKQQGFCKL